MIGLAFYVTATAQLPATSVAVFTALFFSQGTQVCQIRVMTEFETITLTQNGAVDLRTIGVFLFPKFNRQPFFFFAIEI